LEAFLRYTKTTNSPASIGGLTTQLRGGPQVAARAREGFERSLHRKARDEIDPERKLSDEDFAWRFQRWRSIYFKRLRAVGVRKQRIKLARKPSDAGISERVD
jgi:hypothetical protein